MIFEQITVGAFGANCYVIGCEETGQGIVVDPGGDPERILSVIRQKGLEITYILNTHGHVDHVSANGRLKEATGAMVLIHELDAPLLKEAPRSMLYFGLSPVSVPEADRLLKEGDAIEVGKIRIEVIHTPGHTPGGICLKLGNKLLTGDTVFAGSIGRTDFPGGSYSQIIESIKTKILPLGDDVELYPGHGPATTVAEEKKYNPFLV